MPRVLAPPHPPRPDRAALRRRHADLRRPEAQALLRLCRTAALFTAVDGPRWCGPWSLRDFVRSQLGVPLPTFLGWKRVGRLVALRPALAVAWRQGRVTFKDLDALARAGSFRPEDPDEGVDAAAGSERSTTEGGGSEPPTTSLERDPAYRTVRLAMPAPVARRLRSSLRLARALLGHDAGDDEALAALLAEASTEVPPSCTAAEARARLRLPPARPSRPRPRTAPLPPDPRLAALRAGTARRALAHRLCRLLLRQLRRYEDLQVRVEDRLLSLLEDAAHARAGYPSFEAFAREVLDLPRSTAFDRLRRARLRRRDDPLAQARARGHLTAVQHEQLDRLRRQAHVPASDLPPWVAWAKAHTTRALARALLWALDRRDSDYRAWEQKGCPPPTEDELRTANRPLHEVARRPSRLDLRRLAHQPATTLSWVLREDTVDLLAWLTVSLQDRARQKDGAALPLWAALLQLDALARESWAVHVRPMRKEYRQVFDRDDGLCLVPECTGQCDLHRHHFVFASHGGSDLPQNLGMVCWRHHQQGTHGGPLRVTGQPHPDGRALTWEMGLDENGRPRRVYRGEVVVV